MPYVRSEWFQLTEVRPVVEGNYEYYCDGVLGEKDNPRVLFWSTERQDFLGEDGDGLGKCSSCRWRGKVKLT